ncbi:DUF6660 family protein [uncultured Tenacibaculum sp.]|uniref:DUF6660 family protein n=1 Tax=uncultured Tenacibaculum sp. TaxID=174713 RepID=UPI0034279AE3
MKFFAIILSFYFLALQVVPCNDDANIVDDSQTISVVDFDGDHDQDCEMCSPFCHCHCCHAHGISALNFFTDTEHQLIDGEITSKDMAIVQDVSFRFFQPPRRIG